MSNSGGLEGAAAMKRSSGTRNKHDDGFLDTPYQREMLGVACPSKHGDMYSSLRFFSD